MDSGTIWLVSAICVDGLIMGANFIELTLLVKYWRRRSKRAEILIFSLCISDLLCGTAAFIEDSIQLSSMLHVKATNESEVQAYLFDSLFAFSILSSNLHVISIAVKKLLKEVLPAFHQKLDSKSNKTVNVCIVWFLAVVMAPVMSILPDVCAKKAIIGFSAVQDAYGAVFLTACVIVFFTYLSLYIILANSEKKQRELMKSLQPGEIESTLRDRRNSYICLLLGISFLVCVLPFSLGLLEEKFYHPFWNILITINHLFNPLIYFFRTLLDKRQMENDKKLLIGMKDIEIGVDNDTYERTQDSTL